MYIDVALSRVQDPLTMAIAKFSRRLVSMLMMVVFYRKARYGYVSRLVGVLKLVDRVQRCDGNERR